MTEQHIEEHAGAYADVDVTAWQQQIIAEFRENNGTMSGMFEGWSLLVVSTIGAKSGLVRSSLVGRVDIDGQLIIVASAMGAPRHPAWYHNIRKNPKVTVETGTETYEAIAAIPPDAQRDKLFEKVVEVAPGYGEYQAKTTREIPVVVLHRIEPAPGAERVKGMGDFLVEVHGWLRQELAELRRQVDEIVEGTVGSGTSLERPVPDLGLAMRTHCVKFCEGLKKHHTGEDLGLFPELARQFPALAPALRKLGEDHAEVGRLQDEIEQLVEAYVPGESEPTRLRAALEVLTSQLETHFDYEEKTVVTALNATAAAPNFG